jgi:cysteine desulfurase
VRVYLDHNATTPLRPEVRTLLAELQGEPLGNPSSLHASGRRARHLIDEARARVAAALHVHEDEVVFTAGGTEATNLALAGALAAAGPPAGLVTSAVEHSSVLATAAALERGGHPVERAGVDPQGRLALDALAAAIARPSTALVSIQRANNEVGVVHALERVVELARGRAGKPALVHTDAVQALGRTTVTLGAGGADLASFSAHKVGGPPGVGILYRRRGVALVPLLFGGDHEGGLRPGTEAAANIAAAALAIELAARERAQHAARTAPLTRSLWTELASRLPEARLIGPPIDASDRLPNTLCVALPRTDGKVLVARLDLEGLEVSAGSACASGALEPSHVLSAMGLDESAARAGLRLSLGWSTTRAECAAAVDILVKVVRGPRAS